MFATIGHTFSLMKMSWEVLQKDRELIFFPVLSAIGLLILGLIGVVVLGSMAQAEGSTEASSDGSLVLYIVFIILAYFITTFFNAALVSAALERLRGGDPNVSSGLIHASKHIHHIFIWALMNALITIILTALKNRQDNFFVRMIFDMIGGIWEFLTFFVIPVMVSENEEPISAIKRSASIVRETWGRQITATFGFMLVYILAIVISVIPALLIYFVFPIGGIVVGVLLVGLALSVVQTLEGIFKAALYDFAMGEQPEGFDLRTLQTAYQPAPA